MSEGKKADAVKPAKEEKKPVDSAGFCCYVGPTVLGHIQKGTIYPGEKKEVLKRDDVLLVLDKYPDAASLIVDGNMLAESEKKVKTKGTSLYEKARMLTKKK